MSEETICEVKEEVFYDSEFYSLMNLKACKTVYMLKSKFLFEIFKYQQKKDEKLSVYVCGDVSFLTESSFNFLNSRAKLFNRRKHKVIYKKKMESVVELEII